ncbi:MAG: hypothetical protein APR62_10955 [Smithella sp. SDB]|nr:MAG: hypothetical protein APR62_10955 [Smithella sp. SDB]
MADFKYLPISFEKREWAGKNLPVTLKNTAPWEYNPVAFLLMRLAKAERSKGRGVSRIIPITWLSGLMTK